MDFERKGIRRLFFKATDDLNFELRIAGAVASEGFFENFYGVTGLQCDGNFV
jgi:hypothetical protein